MTISPIGAAGVSSTGPLSAASRTAPAADSSGFAGSITKALDELDQLHSSADSFATQAATGELESVTDYLVAATEAQLATQVTVAVRNRAVEAFNDIMRMPV